MLDIIFLLIFLLITYSIGSSIEKKHYKKIKQREIALIKKPVVNNGAKTFKTNRKVKSIELVSGEVVISGDYFKNFVSELKKLFGGQLTPFESILDRARREAVLRMREKAKHANIILNTKIEYCMLNNLYVHGQIPKCAVIAYGTAVTYEPVSK